MAFLQTSPPKFLSSPLFISLLLPLGLQTSQAYADDSFGDVPSDKAQHFAIAGAAQTACEIVGVAMSKRKWASTLTCFLLINTAGIAKEAIDPYVGHQREARDIAANLAGSGVAMVAFSISF